jgi:starch synthase (maltosyl-transferring)
VPDLWLALRDVVEHCAGEGARIFRVDNPHTKPLPFWEWLIAEVRAVDQDVVFLAEAFTRPAMMLELAKVGFNQSYTYFTWRNSRWELEQYITELANDEINFFRPNFFVNTPDILSPYLQEGGRPAFEARLVLAATLSPSYGVYSGYEACENIAIAIDRVRTHAVVAADQEPVQTDASAPPDRPGRHCRSSMPKACM